MNGSGKTTFIKLLCHLYDPTEGEILPNGIDIRKWIMRGIHENLSVVFFRISLSSFPWDKMWLRIWIMIRNGWKPALMRPGLITAINLHARRAKDMPV